MNVWSPYRFREDGSVEFMKDVPAIKCESCGKILVCRPYGPGFSWICYVCMKAIEKFAETSFADITTALELARDRIGPKRPAMDVFLCPKCQIGKVTVLVLVDGLVLGRCSKEGCISWVHDGVPLVFPPREGEERRC